MEKITQEYIQQCKKAGMTCSEIAKDKEVSCSTIYSFCKRHNITLPNARRGGGNVIDMKGQVFGSLTVVSRAESKQQLAMWKCLCECGNTCICRGADLRQGKIKTCGCRKGIKSRRNWQGYGLIPKSYWSSLVKNAEQRNKKFDVTIEDVNRLLLKQNLRCALSGREISFKDGSASLDRIDNDRGYTIDNVQWVHKDINRAKQKFSQEEFVLLCEQVAEHRKANK